MSRPRPTRGHGLLEPLLARLRARQANRLIPDSLRGGRILDVGCGSYPYFLAHTAFEEKFAIERRAPSAPMPKIHWHTLNLDDNTQLPFPDRFFDAITMLAVVEHLNPDSLIDLYRECYRLLRPGGMVVITTPAAWSDGLLDLMARFNLVSAEEIDDHVFTYTLPLLGWCFGSAGFAMNKIRFGYFEFMLNLWATAER